MEGLDYHGVPLYLRAVIGTYLRGRKIFYPGRDGAPRSRDVCGVSVLTLWNVGYHEVLRGFPPPGLNLVCYADDTLIRGDNEEALVRASAGTWLVADRIRRLGLSVTLQKTEALWLRGPRRRLPARRNLRIDGVNVPVGHTVKYLGLTLDSRWDFRALRSLGPPNQRHGGGL